MTVFSKAVREYRKACASRDIPEETVMSYLVEISRRERYDLYMHYEEEMPAALEAEFRAGMERILNDEPMAHVLGYSWFYGYKMIVNGDVLIPRVETEELCAYVLARLDRYFSGQEKIDCADVGTGSGAIGITVKLEEPRTVMTVTDISEEALAVARENAALNEAEMTFLAGDMLKPLIDAGIHLDVLISNPPYIPQDEQMERSVVDFEPHVALFGGADGLKFYRDIFRDCRQVLRERAMMAFEMGWNQRENLTALVHEYLPEARCEVIRDMSGKDRILFVYLNIDDERTEP